MPIRLSLSMIVKNGAATLGRCLDSMKGLADEMVVIDTGSTDGSQAIAEAHGAKVVPWEWTDSFADARNVSLDHCRGDWIVWLDADESLDPDQQALFKSLLNQLPETPTVYLMEQSSEQSDPDAGILSVSQARLFRRLPGLRWRYRIHEQILPACNALGFVQVRVPIVIRHSGYAVEPITRAKEERNRKLLQRESAENPDDTWVLYQLGRIQCREHQDEARAILHRALQKARPDDALRRRIHSLLIELEITLGRPEAAQSTAQTALAEIPNDTNLLNHAGRLAFEAGDLENATAHFSKLLDTPPDPDEYLHALDLSLRGWRTRHNLAVVLHKQGKLEEAEALWRRNATEGVDPTYSWLWLATLFLNDNRNEDLDEALRHLEMLKDVASLSLKSQARLMRKEFDAARSSLAEWIALEPRNLTPRLWLSRSYIQESIDLEAAEASLLEVLELEPSHPEATYNLDVVRSYCEDLDAED